MNYSKFFTSELDKLKKEVFIANSEKLIDLLRNFQKLMKLKEKMKGMLKFGVPMIILT